MNQIMVTALNHCTLKLHGTVVVAFTTAVKLSLHFF